MLILFLWEKTYRIFSLSLSWRLSFQLLLKTSPHNFPKISSGISLATRTTPRLSKRRNLTIEFKARVAHEALKEEKTIQQIAKENDIAPTQISAWKKELESRMAEIFERKNAANEAAVKHEKKAARLERKVGQLVIEKEFLEGKCEELGRLRKYFSVKVATDFFWRLIF